MRVAWSPSWGDSGFGTDKIIGKWVERSVLRPESIGEVWSKQSRRNQGVCCKKRDWDGENRRVHLGSRRCAQGPRGSLQHVKGSQWLEKVVQG